MANYLVLGYGGIAEAITDKLVEQNHQVAVVSRRSEVKHPSIQLHQIDMTKPSSADDLSDLIKDFMPDVVINTIGVLHEEDNMPEKNFNQLKAENLAHSMWVNTMPTLYLVQALDKHMKKSSKLKVVTLSARVSSISDNKLGGWYSYRMSKASLNMLIKNIAIEWQRKYPESAIYGYHPGTVDTDLSKPFQAHVPPEQLFSPEQAADYFIEVVGGLEPSDTGGLFDWRGDKISF